MKRRSTHQRIRACTLKIAFSSFCIYTFIVIRWRYTWSLNLTLLFVVSIVANIAIIVTVICTIIIAVVVIIVVIDAIIIVVVIIPNECVSWSAVVIVVVVTSAIITFDFSILWAWIYSSPATFNCLLILS